MASANRLSAASWLLVFVAALMALAAVFSPVQADVKKLKQEIDSIKKDLDKARETEKKAVESLTENQTKQRRAAQGSEEWKKLKRQAIQLSENAQVASEAVQDLAKELADKYSELRDEASKTAEDKVNAKGKAAKLVADAAEALKNWSEALGELPDIPEVRSTKDMDDDEAHAVRSGDLSRLRKFKKWCEDEEKRLRTEIKRARTVEGNKLDGGSDLADDAKALKGSLETRQNEVLILKNTAEDHIDDLEDEDK
ncbi:MAG: hypothetical protein IT462_11965 [Planctomycetes bacterium]|nr:hypothetical protein [Planctomycetota bacterium]